MPTRGLTKFLAFGKAVPLTSNAMWQTVLMCVWLN